MNPAYEFEFTVGETYENEKGLFSVVSIAKEDMVIRWKNGEETQTSIEFQGRIQKRRQWEKTLQRRNRPPRKPKLLKAVNAHNRRSKIIVQSEIGRDVCCFRVRKEA